MNQDDYNNIVKLIEKRDEIQGFANAMNAPGLFPNARAFLQNLGGTMVQQLPAINQCLEESFNNFESNLANLLSVIAENTQGLKHNEAMIEAAITELATTNNKINSLRSENTSLTSKISEIRMQIEMTTSELQALKKSNSDLLTGMNPKQKAFVLMKAIEYKNNETKNFIIKSDWDFEFRNGANESLLDVALKAEDTEMVRFFINHAIEKYNTNNFKTYETEYIAHHNNENSKNNDLDEENIVAVNFFTKYLSNKNLQRQDLSDMNFDNIDLSGTNLQGAILENANLSNANLSGADLRGAKMKGAIFAHANLSGAKFDINDLRDANLANTNFSNYNFERMDLSDMNLSHVNLSGAINDANLYQADLSDANLSEANVENAILTPVTSLIGMSNEDFDG